MWGKDERRRQRKQQQGQAGSEWIAGSLVKMRRGRWRQCCQHARACSIDRGMHVCTQTSPAVLRCSALSWHRCATHILDLRQLLLPGLLAAPRQLQLLHERLAVSAQLPDLPLGGGQLLAAGFHRLQAGLWAGCAGCAGSQVGGPATGRSAGLLT